MLLPRRTAAASLCRAAVSVSGCRSFCALPDRYQKSQRNALIHGGGITGLLCALALDTPPIVIDPGFNADLKISSLASDETAVPLHPNTTERLFNVDQNFCERVLLKGHRLQHLRVYGSKGEEWGRLAVADVPVSCPTLVLPRKDLYSLLHERAVEKWGGCDSWCSTQNLKAMAAEDLTVGADGIKSQLRSSDPKAFVERLPGWQWVFCFDTPSFLDPNVALDF
eukprot:gnl/Hemi2/3865_TR1357_c0_g1_i1.p1 gnl/Hemi2/3865_TR1357_c0_g1~~gnl/Hemi2/3865_TR1357_c0_g1_i1.p1  ORF type:complete len:224 (-),score=23.90 gnl/Hemi2/3865_TR1357_c0_g1_i1:504-1175(-)